MGGLYAVCAMGVSVLYDATTVWSGEGSVSAEIGVCGSSCILSFRALCAHTLGEQLKAALAKADWTVITRVVVNIAAVRIPTANMVIF